jgi:N-carbamoyl-L-amino-acid hydrolase
LSDARSAADANGTTVAEECDRLAYTGSATVDDLLIDTFLELHIEQGPLLERERIDIGVVKGVQGLSWWEVTVIGSSNHAGTTPMNLRDDAGLMASKLMTALRRLPERIPDLRLTIGSVRYHPNLINVIPDKVTFTVDMRHPSEEMLVRAEEFLSDIVSDKGSSSERTQRASRAETRISV